MQKILNGAGDTNIFYSSLVISINSDGTISFFMSNKAITTKLFHHCINSNVILEEPEAIEAIQAFLSLVASKNDIDNGYFSEIYHEEIKRIFRNAQHNYTVYIDAMRELGLILVDEYYDYPTSTSPNSKHESECKKYLVTNKGIELLTDSNLIEISSILSDPKLNAAIEKMKVKKMNRMQPLEDPFSNYIQHKLSKSTIANKDIETLISGSASEPPLTQASITNNILKVKYGRFSVPKYNESDGRNTNDYTMMPDKVKNHLTIKYCGKNYRRRYKIDVRSCVPSFFSAYIFDSAVKFNPVQLDSAVTYFNAVILKTINHSSNILISEEGTNGTFAKKRQCFWGILKNQEITKEGYFNALHEENRAWLDLFLNVDKDPRSVIAEQMNEDKDYLKQAINETLNGSMQHPEYILWMKKTFPLLYTSWQILGNINETGPKICKKFEVVLFQNEQLLKLANTMDIILGYENDGFSIYADPEDMSVQSKTEAIVRYITTTATEKWGFSPFIKMQVLEDNIDDWFDPTNTKKVLDRLDEYWQKMNKANKKRWINKDTKMWFVYYKAFVERKEQYEAFFSKHKAVIEAGLNEMKEDRKRQKAYERMQKRFLSGEAF